MKRLVGVVATVAMPLTAAPRARADALDRALNDRMPDLVQRLRDRGYRTVGVLRFRAQKGTRPASFQVAPINASLTARLENLLVIHAGTDEARALGVLHDPSAT